MNLERDIVDGRAARKEAQKFEVRPPESKRVKDERWDLEERLLEFSAQIVRTSELLPRTRAGLHLSGQLLRSGTSPLLNHGEAESAESPQDFIHKLSVCLKELRETLRCLKLIARVPLVKSPGFLSPLMKESDELIRIFAASISTARRRTKSQ